MDLAKAKIVKKDPINWVEPEKVDSHVFDEGIHGKVDKYRWAVAKREIRKMNKLLENEKWKIEQR